MITAPRVRFESVDELRQAALFRESQHAGDHSRWRQRIVKRALVCLCGADKQPGIWLCPACFAACPKHLCGLVRHKRHDEGLRNRLMDLMLDFADRRRARK